MSVFVCRHGRVPQLIIVSAVARWSLVFLVADYFDSHIDLKDAKD